MSGIGDKLNNALDVIESLPAPQKKDKLCIVPITLKKANEFIKEFHRHNKPPRGHKFSIGLNDNDGKLVGVAVAGRPSARLLDDGLTLEITRTCTNGTRNANSMLYGAIWRCAKAMGYKKCITYTQCAESGASLRAVGWLQAARLKPRKSWAESSKGKLKDMRDKVGNGGVARIRWEILAT